MAKAAKTYFQFVQGYVYTLEMLLQSTDIQLNT